MIYLQEKYRTHNSKLQSQICIWFYSKHRIHCSLTFWQPMFWSDEIRPDNTHKTNHSCAHTEITYINTQVNSGIIKVSIAEQNPTVCILCIVAGNGFHGNGCSRLWKMESVELQNEAFDTAEPKIFEALVTERYLAQEYKVSM